MRDLEMEWGGGMNYRINPFYYFIECSFLDSQLETMCGCVCHLLHPYPPLWHIRTRPHP